MDPKKIAREKAAYLYTTALEAGDFDTVEAILKLAETDAELDEIIQGLHQALDDEHRGKGLLH